MDQVLTGVTAIAGGYAHTIALKDGAVLAWGRNSEGQCNIPAAAKSGVTAIAGGAIHTIALKDGAVLAWGGNDYYGQCLGTDRNGKPITSTPIGEPVRVMGQVLTGVSAIAGCGYHTIVLMRGIDANNNNRPDTCDISDDPSLDRNNNGIMDIMDIARNPSIDCNLNIIIDDFDLLDHPEWDCNFNGRIDTCDFAEGASDDDVDGHLDTCEWAKGDLDLNGVVDTGDTSIVLLYFGEMNSDFGDFDGNGIIDTGDVSYVLLNFGEVPWP